MKHSPLHGPRSLIAPLCLLGLGASCQPYGTYGENDDDSLGAVDPVTFPAANIGTGGDRKRPGRGRFSEVTAYVAGEAIGYFSFPVATVPTGANPLWLQDDGAAYPPVPTPAAYSFDATDTSPFPVDDDFGCAPPAGYAFDEKRDDVDYSQQGSVFSALPSATYAEGVASTTSYVPVVAEVPLNSAGHRCQSLKSKALVEKAYGAKPALSGNYLAWLIIDPSAPVYPRDAPTGLLPGGDPNNPMMHPGIGLQRWGWYNRFLLAYLDGGYIPTEDVNVMAGTAAMPVTKMVKRMKPQRLFVPRRVVGQGMTMAAGKPGSGYDVLEAKRGTPGYSPICQIWLYGDAMAAMPPMATELPKDVAAIMANPALTPAAATPASYVYCLQVR